MNRVRTCLEGTCAVVVGADACGLGIARSLGKGRVPVIMVDTNARRPGMHSRHANAFISSAMSGQGLVESLLALQTRLGCRPVLFLTSDAQVQTVSEHRERLAPVFRIPLPTHCCVNELLHKPSFQRIAETLGFPIPRALIIRNIDDLVQLMQIQYPAVIKPATKNSLFNNLVPRASRVSGPDQADAICRAALPAVPDLIVQEWIEGAESDIYFCLQYRAEDGSTISSFTGRKIRCWPPQTGSTASCMPALDAAKTLEPLTTAFFDQTRFVGMCSMEFKRDQRTGAFLMIEPTVGRADWQEEIATLNGVNIPLAAFRHELGQPPLPRELLGATLVWRDPACYWRSVVAARSFRDNTPPAATVRSSCWRADDPTPVPFFWLEWLEKIWRPSRWQT
jgi:D-aspartate ligase